MPRKYRMSWEGAPHFRWVKMHKGKRHRVSCDALKLPRASWTKELSYQAANDWWAKKRAELEGGNDADHPHAEFIADLQRKLGYAQRHGMADEAATLAARVEEAKVLPPDDTPSDPETIRRVEAARLFGADIPTDFDPEAARQLFGDERVWRERFRRETSVPPERTVKALGDRWVAGKCDEARKQVRSADGADNIRIALSHFVTFTGPATPADDLNADLWHRWFVHCQAAIAMRDADEKQGWSAGYAGKVFGIARSFVKWLWEREVLASLPRNLDKGEYRFERPDKAIPTFSKDEVRMLLDGATGQHKLHLLLMLNCGMTQKDISDLLKNQINFTRGAITRRRSKTKRQKGAVEVSYPLWPETLRLLREYLSDDPDIALVTKSKQRWVRKKLLDNGKLRKADNVATLFQHLRRKVKLSGAGKSLKVFRKTSATRLKADSRYRDLRFYFLGHSARTIADRHYAAESEALMAEAVQWLGREYGLLT